MILGFRRKGGTDEPAAQADKAALPAEKKQRRRKPGETLASVVKESTPGAAIDLLRRNEVFVLPNNAGWVILLLNVEDPKFGGLSLKHRGDEAKGSIIELITGDELQVVATAEMLAADVLGIVPNAQSLDRMYEYRILREAPFIWGGVYLDEAGELQTRPISEASYDQALLILRGNSSVQRELPELWAWAEGSDDEADAPADDEDEDRTQEMDLVESADADDEGQLAEADLDDEPFAPAQEVPVQQESYLEPVAEAGLYDPEDEGAIDYGALDAADGGAEAYYEDDEQGDPEDEAQAVYDAYVAQNADRDVPLEEVRETLVRRMAGDDLDIEVDTVAFDQTFLAGAPAVAIDVGPDDSWLGAQVNGLVRQANAELLQLHMVHTADLRSKFVQMVSLHAEETIKRLDPDKPGGEYGDLMAAAKAEYQDRQAQGADEVARTRAEITKRFEREADNAAQAAAASARARHLTQTRSLRERLLAEAGAGVEARAEDAYAANRRMLMEMRRRDAVLSMDLGTTRALQLLADRHEEQQAAEMDLMRGWTEQIMAFIDENRKNDVAHSEALAEQMARSNQVEELSAQFARERQSLAAEHARERQSLAAEHALRLRRAEEALEQSRRDALLELQSREEVYTHEIGVVRNQVAESNKLVEALTAQLATMKGAYEEEYEGRISTLAGDKESFARQLDRANHLQSRANKVLISLMVIIGVATFMIGVLVGGLFLGDRLAPGMILPDPAWVTMLGLE